MERSLQEQFFSQIDKAGRILIALPQLLSVDTQGTAEALRIFLAGQGKVVTIASAGKPLENFSFLKEPTQITNQVVTGGPLILTVDTKRAKLDELRYEVVGDTLQIILAAKEGDFRPEEVSIAAKAEKNFDLIIVLGASSLDQLGELFSNNTELFYDTPKIAIGVDSAHEYFGTTNIVDVTASSLSEIAAQLFFDTNRTIDPETATALLAGMISATASFQDVRTTPKTFSLAAHLIELGGRQQDIIIALFKSRDFTLLKLWGRLLARVKTVNHTLLYSTLPAQDFEKTGTGSANILPAFWELLDNISGYQTLALLAEPAPGSLELVLATLPHVARDPYIEIFGSSQIIEESPHGQYRLTRLILSGSDISSAEKLLQSVAAPK